MSNVKQLPPPSPIIISQRRRRFRHTEDRPSTLRRLSLGCRSQTQTHQSLPPLIQKPQLCIPTPPEIITSPTTSEPSPASTEGRKWRHSLAKASDILRLMDGLRLPLDAKCYVSLLQDCASSGDLLGGAAVHSHIRFRYPGGSSILRRPEGLGIANRLLHMYASCGEAEAALEVFDQMTLRDSTSRIITIAALSESRRDMEALQLFVKMHSGSGDWWAADPIGFVVVLRACGRAGELGLAKQLHGMAIKLIKRDSFAEYSSSLIRLYAKLGCPDASLQLMVVSPPSHGEETALACIATAYSKSGCFRKALWVFREIGRRGIRKGKQKTEWNWRKMFASILVACGAANSGKDGYEGGRQIHSLALKIALDGDPSVMCCLFEFYSKHGLLQEARKAFS
ncbi:hypothetical protein HPP92_016974 [Vanilla planifolia]|uniref:Pentatricopeptide repeat-containing protein n=1 Tax=Vanilla planifolia TaxID=51239 RepID=A0A835UNY9_VANPL|nr:hypothetical protein HPP92_016974 [Vanilla planifolia]